MQVRAFVETLRENGAAVNMTTAIACAEGIVKSKDSNLLACSGGCISLTKHMGKCLLFHVGFVKEEPALR